MDPLECHSQIQTAILRILGDLQVAIRTRHCMFELGPTLEVRRLLREMPSENLENSMCIRFKNFQRGCVHASWRTVFLVAAIASAAAIAWPGGAIFPPLIAALECLRWRRVRDERQSKHSTRRAPAS